MLLDAHEYCIHYCARHIGCKFHLERFSWHYGTAKTENSRNYLAIMDNGRSPSYGSFIINITKERDNVKEILRIKISESLENLSTDEENCWTLLAKSEESYKKPQMNFTPRNDQTFLHFSLCKCSGLVPLSLHSKGRDEQSIQHSYTAASCCGGNDTETFVFVELWAYGALQKITIRPLETTISLSKAPCNSTDVIAGRISFVPSNRQTILCVLARPATFCFLQNVRTGYT